MTTEENRIPTDEELTVMDFKPGVGYVCVDANGKKWIKRTVISMASQVKSNSKRKFIDEDGKKIHMSKKARRDLKRRYYEAVERAKAQEASKKSVSTT